MSELPNLIWVLRTARWGDAQKGDWSSWASDYKGDGTPYVPASELEQARDKLAEYGEEIARLREELENAAAHMVATLSVLELDPPLISEELWVKEFRSATMRAKKATIYDH